jgi:phage-related holin
MTYLWAITVVHTLISFVALAAGIFAVADLLRLGARGTAMRLFLWTAFLTSATGFLFPALSLTPAVVVGIIALLVLAAVAWAARRLNQAGPYRAVYGAGVVASLYLLVFVAIAQAFQKVPVLHAMAPTGGELPFALSQGVALLLFIAIGVVAVRGGRAMDIRPA